MGLIRIICSFVTETVHYNSYHGKHLIISSFLNLSLISDKLGNEIFACLLFQPTQFRILLNEVPFLMGTITRNCCFPHRSGCRLMDRLSKSIYFSSTRLHTNLATFAGKSRILNELLYINNFKVAISKEKTRAKVTFTNKTN